MLKESFKILARILQDSCKNLIRSEKILVRVLCDSYKYHIGPYKIPEDITKDIIVRVVPDSHTYLIVFSR